MDIFAFRRLELLEQFQALEVDHSQRQAFKRQSRMGAIFVDNLQFVI